MLKNKIRGFTKNLAIGLIGLVSATTLLATTTTIESSAHNAYFVSITIDEVTFKYVPTVIFEENDWVSSNHREAELGNFGKHTVGESWKVPVIDYETEFQGEQSEDKLKEKYKDTVADGDGKEGLMFTFPPVHGGDWWSEKIDGSGVDEMLADRYANYVVNGLNDALNFCISQSGGKNSFKTNELKTFSAKLANKQSGISINGSTPKVTITTATATEVPKPLEGLEVSDYVTISCNGQSISVPYQMRKGYRGENAERTGLSSKYKGKVDSMDTKYLDWKYTVLQGNYNADVKVITYSSLSQITKPSALTIAMSDFFGSTLRALRTSLGLYPIEDLMLNGGQRMTQYYWGLMPKDWMNSAILLHIVSQAIAWGLMSFSFVRLIFKRQLQTMNIGERISLMEGFKNLILTALLLGMFPLIFNALGRINYLLVDVFAKSSLFSTYMGTTQTMNSGDMANIFINLAFFVLGCYFNFFYVLRAVTIAILYGIAPLCIFSLSLGGKYTQVFSSFMKELVSNIFVQTLHAICVAFFTSVTSTSQMKVFEILVVLIAFIPITNFIRQNLLGLSSGITDQANTAMALGGAVGGMVVGGAMNTAGGAISKASGGSGGTGGTSRSGGSGITDAGGAIKHNKLQQALSNKEHIPSTGKGISDNKDVINGMADYSNASGGSRNIDLAGVDKKGMAISALKGGARTLAGVGLVGTALGSAMTGERRTMETSMRGANNFLKSASEDFSDIGAGAYQGLSGGRQFYKTEDEGKADKYTGMNSIVKDKGDAMVLSYDTQADGDGRVQFKNDAINNSNVGSNIREMNDAFKGTGEYAVGGKKHGLQKQAIERYQNQGIRNAGMGADGKFKMEVDKNYFSKKGASFEGLSEIAPFRGEDKQQTQTDNNSEQMNFSQNEEGQKKKHNVTSNYNDIDDFYDDEEEGTILEKLTKDNMQKKKKTS